MGKKRRKVCFVTGTRAEFGLMKSALEAIRTHPALELAIIATGMHLDERHGKTVHEIERAGFGVDERVKWIGQGLAQATGNTIAGLAAAFERVGPEIVLVVGDRVEAFAAASAAHLSGLAVAHVHGGDRAMGQVDDALRHAITKLAHIHFPATKQSAQRIKKMGEQEWRIHQVGSPGLDGILDATAPREEWPAEMRKLTPSQFGLLVLHPVDADERIESRRAQLVLRATRAAGIKDLVIIHPNNDPGSRGIMRVWDNEKRAIIRRNTPRPIFLGLLREAAVLIGNSSSGIIEAASFGLPVLDIGPRQQGRERGKNVTHCEYDMEQIQREAARIWNAGKPRKFRGRSIYGCDGAGVKLADILARLEIDGRLLRKIIAY
jgi:GDP/UDP-N,N'-diacetylbacillosamine 2-epimerase (hydrolysing)